MPITFTAALILAVSFFAVVSLTILAAVVIHSVSRRSPYAGSNPGKTTCPHCHELVPVSLAHCSHCGTKLWAPNH